MKPRIPTFEYPDAAARSFAYMWRYSSYLQALYETPVFAGDLPEDGPRRVAEIIAGAVAKNRTVLTEHESKQVLAAYELPVTLSKAGLVRGRSGGSRGSRLAIPWCSN